MTERFKERLLGALLLVLTLWPIAHIGLVFRFDLNPWKLAGWGMYTVPQLPPYLRVYGSLADGSGRQELTALDPALDPEHQRFLRRRYFLRELTRPDRFAHALLERYPGPERVTIVVFQPYLDPKTGMLEERSTEYDYPRRGDDPT